MKNSRVVFYIIKETLPSLLTGIFVFISILLMFQVLKLTEFVLAHGVPIKIILELVGYISISFLPAILPMSVLFSVIMTYGRLSSDSEIIAFKSLGISQQTLTVPAITIGLIMTILSAQTYFFIGPWGARRSNELFSSIASTQVVSSIREGTFVEGFYDLVVYANNVNEKKGVLKDVFIYDERTEKIPLTIIAQEGQIMSSPDLMKSTVLRLFNGSIHRSGEGIYTKIQFDNYDIFLQPSIAKTDEARSPKTMTIREVKKELRDPITDQKRTTWLETEYYKRWALPFACIIFSLIGVGLGTVVNRRVAKSGGFVVSVSLIVAYWVLYVGTESFAKNGTIPPMISLWIPNFLFAIVAIYSLKMIWNK